GQYALVAFLALDLNQGSGLTLAEASIFVAIANVAGIIGRVLWGLVTEQHGGGSRQAYLLTINFVGLIGALLLFVVPRTAPMVVIGLIVALAGVALIGYQGLWITSIAAVAGPEGVGAARGFAITFVASAIAVSPPLYGLVADLAGTYRAIWAVLAVMPLIALVSASLVR